MVALPNFKPTIDKFIYKVLPTEHKLLYLGAIQSFLTLNKYTTNSKRYTETDNLEYSFGPCEYKTIQKQTWKEIMNLFMWISLTPVMIVIIEQFRRVTSNTH